MKLDTVQLIELAFTLMLWTHFAACTWYFIGSSLGLQKNWVFNFNFQDESKFNLYLFSFYWAVVSLTTAGYGDIRATNEGIKI